MMNGRVITIDDSILKGLIDSQELWSDFPKLEKLSQRYKLAPKPKCKCRKSSNNIAPIFAEAKAYIQSLSSDKKALLKKFLKADYIKMNVVDVTGRHSTFTF